MVERSIGPHIFGSELKAPELERRQLWATRGARMGHPPKVLSTSEKKPLRNRTTSKLHEISKLVPHYAGVEEVWYSLNPEQLQRCEESEQKE